MKSADVRSTFLNYFAKQGHTPVASSRIVPENDPTILFTNAGMNQFKNTFLGLESRPYNRATTSQKCVRAGGKHNDLENVGFTARHHTFFEMLGNFSFGDYFKKDAIHFAWELLLKEYGMDKNRLYVSVYEEDDEAAEIWQKQEGVPKDRIFRFGQADNFWRMGETGPCGPCSEIYYDLGDKVGGDPKENRVGGSGDRFVEIWNLVFMQYNEDESKKLNPLPKPSVDTGAGLERMSAVMQGVLSNYDTDAFIPLLEKASQLSKIKYDTNTEFGAAMRVLADHARVTSFLIADGVLPSNEGRGYVLRRIMRRAIRYGRKLSQDTSFLPQMAQTVIDQMKNVYPELQSQNSQIVNTIKDEEARFLTTLDQGTEIFNDAVKKIQNKGQKTLEGEVIFKLYDTFGFPMDLTRLMAQEQGVKLDEAGFETRMNQARETAKSSWKGKSMSADTAMLVKVGEAASKKAKATEFTGYTEMSTKGNALVLSSSTEVKKSLGAGESGLMVCDKTCFYAESGGQVGDKGTFEVLDKGKVIARGLILDCLKQNDFFIHAVSVESGSLGEGMSVELKVDASARRQTMANHSATHLMHSALKKVLGDHVSQAGSLVEPTRLRFDFTHNKPMSRDEIEKIETLVNGEISKSITVDTSVKSYKEAIAAGAMALFGEKYGDQVRVLKMGDFSTELCGGTHVSNTAMIRLFKILSESGVSSGVRRIEAVTGDEATRYVLQNTYENLQAREVAGIQSDVAVPAYIEKLKGQIKDQEKQLRQMQAKQINVDELAAGAQTITRGNLKFKFVAAALDIEDRDVLSQLTDQIKNKISSGVVVLLGHGSTTHPLIVAVSKDLLSQASAGNILKEVASLLGGKGGGRPDFAQGAVPSRQDYETAFKKAHQLLLN